MQHVVKSEESTGVCSNNIALWYLHVRMKKISCLTHRVINKSLFKVFRVNSQCALGIVHQSLYSNTTVTKT